MWRGQKLKWPKEREYMMYSDGQFCLKKGLISLPLNFPSKLFGIINGDSNEQLNKQT
jgi:hypothetical protein